MPVRVGTNDLGMQANGVTKVTLSLDVHAPDME